MTSPELFRLFAGLLCALGCFTGLASAGTREADEPVEALCPSFTLRGKIEPPLTDTEKKNVCGGPGAWKAIPFGQARFNLTNFLQDRGYHHPVFRIDTQPGPGEKFTVFAGSPTRITSLGIDGQPDELEIGRRRKVVGEILTPQILGTVEQWVFQRMQAYGYPCPKITSEADPETGAVMIHVERGPLQDLVSVIEAPIPGAEPGILRRYDAFRLGQRFNGDLLTVTENRIDRLKILQNAFFTASCGPDGAVARQEVTAGPPRLLSFGFGANTEGLLLARASWRNSRIGNRLSLTDLTLQMSTKVQRLSALINWYNLPYVSRRHLQPYFEVRHQNEDAYEILSAGTHLYAATTWDNRELGIEAYVGPGFDYYHTYRGAGSGDPNTFFTSLSFSLRARSHDFEYWASTPRTGYNVGASLDLSSGKVLSSSSAQRLRLDGLFLWNYREYDPPLWVVGLRGGLRVTMTPERPGEDPRLPAAFFQYLGGSMDLRGFDRQSVPQQGALTAGYLDTEFRLTGVLPYNLEPLVFTDVGSVGFAPWNFDPPILYSPGFGLRWRSPFGVFRTTLARGFPVQPSGGWTFYFSFGEEF